MSGGYFGGKQLGLEDVAEAIDKMIAVNNDDTVNEWGDTEGRFYSVETIERFREASATIKKVAAMMQRIDWLVCCDDCEASFHSRWEEEVKP